MAKNNIEKSDNRSNSSDNLREQLRSLENVLLSWKEERDKEQKHAEKRFQRFLVQLVLLITGALGVLWTVTEMGAWYWDRLQQTNMADKYVTVAVEMYEQENNPDVALQMLDCALELDDCFETRYQKAYITGMKAVQLLLNLDRPFNKDELNNAHKSLADAKFLIQLCPDRPEGYILESQIYTALKEFDHAENSIKKALALVPDHAFAQIRYATLLYNRKKFDQAFQLISEVVASHPDNKWGHLWMGLTLDAKRKKQEAIAHFEKAIKIDPKFDTAIYNLGCSYLYSRPRQYAKARECFQRVLAINPAYYRAYYQLGMSYGYEDRYDVALTYMDKALAISNDYLTAHNWRAVILTEMKRFKEAAETYSAAIMLDPRNDVLYVRRAAAKAEMLQIESAVDDLNFALELNPNNLEAVVNLSNIYLKTNNISLALQKIDSALKVSGNKNALAADLWNLRAKLWQKQGDFKSAVKDQKNAVQCYKSKFTLYYLAFYQFKAAMSADSLATLDELHKVDPKFAPAWKLHVIVLNSGKKYKDALKALDIYLSLKPQDKRMLELKQTLLKIK